MRSLGTVQTGSGDKRGAGRSRAGSEQCRCGGNRRARFPHRRVACFSTRHLFIASPPTRPALRPAAGEMVYNPAVDGLAEGHAAAERHPARAKHFRRQRQSARACDRRDRRLVGRRDRSQASGSTMTWRPNGRAIFWPASSASCTPSTAATPRRCCASATTCSKPPADNRYVYYVCLRPRGGNRLDEAEAVARQALALDRRDPAHHAVTHGLVGRAWRRAGRAAPSREQRPTPGLAATPQRAPPAWRAPCSSS